jgi:hypothetical protein
MCWDVNIVHRNDTPLINSNYWSRLGADICFDPFFKSYLDFNQGLHHQFPAPIILPMKPENMPYYRGPWITSQTKTAACAPPEASNDASAVNHSHCQSIFLAIINKNCHGLCHLANIILETLIRSPQCLPTLHRITKFQHTRNECSSLVGQYIPLRAAIFFYHLIS